MGNIRGDRFGYAGVSRFPDAGDARGIGTPTLRAAEHDSGNFGRCSRRDTHPEVAPMAGGVAAFESLGGFSSGSAARE